MDLTYSQLEELHTLLLEAFPTRPTLARMVLFRLGENLDELATSSNLSDAVFELLRWAQARTRLVDLLQAAVAINPDHVGLRDFVAQVSGASSSPDPGPAPTLSLTWQARRDLRKLLLATYTTDTQVRELCVDFGIFYRQLEGEDLPSRIASLLDIAVRESQAADLAAAAREEADQQADQQLVIRQQLERYWQKAAFKEGGWQHQEKNTLWNEAAERYLGPIYSLAFAPNGAALATGSGDGIVNLWKIADGSLIQTFNGHTDRVNSVAFTPDGQIIASGSTDKTVRLWRVDDGSLLQMITEHTDRVGSIAFAPDGQMLASGSWDGTVRLWRVADGSLVQIITESSTRQDTIAFAPDGHILASAGDQTVQLWGLEDGSLLHTFTGHPNGVMNVAFVPDGQILISDGSHTIRLWRVADGGLIQNFRYPNRVINIAVDSDRQIFASAGYGTVMVWRMLEASPLWVRAEHIHWVTSVVFSPDGQILASGSTDCTVRLWCVDDGSLWHRLGTPH